MIVKLNHKELRQMITEVVKRVEKKVSPTEVFAGLIWHFCINSPDHFYKGEYYDLPVSFHYDNDGISLLEVNYLQQNNQWMLISPDYKHILRIAPLVLKWMDETYYAYVASQQQARALKRIDRRNRRRDARRRRRRPRRRIITLPSSLITPLSQPQSLLRQRPQQQRQAGTQERQTEQGDDQRDNQQNGDSQNDFT